MKKAQQPAKLHICQHTNCQHLHEDGTKVCYGRGSERNRHHRKAHHSRCNSPCEQCDKVHIILLVLFLTKIKLNY